MADETVSMLPGSGCFGSMSKEQLLDMTKNPPPVTGERAAFGQGGDPLRFPKLSEIQARGTAKAITSISASIGRKAYHRKAKEECTIYAATEKDTVVQVKWENGDTSRVKIENLTLL